MVNGLQMITTGPEQVLDRIVPGYRPGAVESPGLFDRGKRIERIPRTLPTLVATDFPGRQSQGLV